jgi:hypothetical protein
LPECDREGVEEFLRLLEWIVQTSGGERNLTKSGVVSGETLRRWRSGQIPRRRSETVEDLERWARQALGDKGYPPEWAPSGGLVGLYSGPASRREVGPPARDDTASAPGDRPDPGAPTRSPSAAPTPALPETPTTRGSTRSMPDRRGRQASVPLAIAVVVVALGAYVAVHLAANPDIRAEGTAHQLSPTPRQDTRIVSPGGGTTAGSSTGVELTGTSAADDLRTRSLFLLDRDADGLYTADVSITVDGHGRWKAEDKPIGDATDVGAQIRILLVAADDSCASYLSRKIDSDQPSFRRLPPGCAVADAIVVRVDRP